MLLRCPLLPPFENMEGIAPPLLLPLRETNRLDPGISEKEDFFLFAFIPPLMPEELDKLALVPVDRSSTTGMDPPPLLHGEDDNVGDVCSGFFPRRNILNAPSHRLRGGVPHGDGAIITESELESFSSDKQDGDPLMN